MIIVIEWYNAQVAGSRNSTLKEKRENESVTKNNEMIQVKYGSFGVRLNRIIWSMNNARETLPWNHPLNQATWLFACIDLWYCMEFEPDPFPTPSHVVFPQTSPLDTNKLGSKIAYRSFAVEYFSHEKKN